MKMKNFNFNNKNFTNKPTSNIFIMKRTHILSNNKENESEIIQSSLFNLQKSFLNNKNSTEKVEKPTVNLKTSPLKLKMNYHNRQSSNQDRYNFSQNRQNFNQSKQSFNQSRQVYKSKSKSPLRQQPLNRYKYNERHHTKSSIIKNQNGNCKYIEQSYIQPFNLKTNKDTPTYKNSLPDLQQIKPISLNLDAKTKIVQNKSTSAIVTKIQIKSSQVINENSKNISEFSKIRVRQNSKHLQFSAKVNNLQKIKNQIESLLSYAYESKSIKKQSIQQKTQHYKPRRYEDCAQSKPYQRRLQVLQKPNHHQPNVQEFTVQAVQTSQAIQAKSKNYKKYQYSNQFLSKHSADNLSKQNKFSDERGNLPPNRKSANKYEINLSQGNIEKSYQKKQICQNAKYQYPPEILIPSQSEQKFSKMTLNQNPDLQFYYESLKKRDQEIQIFKNKLFDPIQNKKNGNSQKFHKQKRRQRRQNNEKHENLQSQLKQKQAFSFNIYASQNQKLQREANNKLETKTRDKSSQKNIFVTQDQIQIYKDINRHQNQIHKDKSPFKVKTIQNFGHDATNYSLKQIDKREQFLQIQRTPKRSKYLDQSLKKQTQLQISNKKSVDNKKDKSKNYLQQLSKVQSSLTLKLDEQIKKIKNQLKDCKQQKQFLRKKYGNLLQNDQNQEFKIIQKTKQMFIKQNQIEPNLIYKRKQSLQSSKQYLQASQLNIIQQRNIQQDNARMFDSYNKELEASLRQEKQQNFNFEIRNTVISSLHNNNSKNQNLVNLRDQERNYNKNTQKKIDKIQHRLQQDSQDEKVNIQKIQTYPSKSLLQQKNMLRSKTPKKFQILLHKIEMTKPQTTKLGNLLAEKIQIDLKLREQRQKFIKITNDKKWYLLRNYFESNFRIRKSQKQWQKILSISPEQHNPFSPSHSSRSDSINILSISNLQSQTHIPILCNLFIESISFFENQLLHKFSKNMLKHQSFSFYELDLQSKGFLSLQDLICFINLHSGKFYRNRDIVFLAKWILLQFQNNPFRNDISVKQLKNCPLYGSQKGCNSYKFSYEFLWNIFTNLDESM